jgi:hypothetical protein
MLSIRFWRDWLHKVYKSGQEKNLLVHIYGVNFWTFPNFLIIYRNLILITPLIVFHSSSPSHTVLNHFLTVDPRLEPFKMTFKPFITIFNRLLPSLTVYYYLSKINKLNLNLNFFHRFIHFNRFDFDCLALNQLLIIQVVSIYLKQKHLKSDFKRW